jgi:glycosyltransferase involved in cell wall biosynthesis
MIRICETLCNEGYKVSLIGVQFSNSPKLIHKNFNQQRIKCFFKKGFGFYAEYNVKLFFTLLFKKADLFCAIDLDTIMPVFFAGKMKNKALVYDAHEYFSQQKEIFTRPKVYKIWHYIENYFVQKFKNGYTVCYSISNAFKELYKIKYEVIMNATSIKISNKISPKKEKLILYQGAVNEARGLEYLIPAMKNVDGMLHIYGNGNFMGELKTIIHNHCLEEKVIIKGRVSPAELHEITNQYYIGLNLVENIGLNQYYSLANKFFDYMHAGIPQVSMNFPEYKRINDEFEIAVLIDNLEPNEISNAINKLLTDDEKYAQLVQHSNEAKLVYNWENESKKLIQFYKNIFEQ